MNEESGGVLGWKVSCFGKDLFEFFVGKDSRLFETAHGLKDFQCLKACSFSADTPRVIEVEIASTGDSGLVCFVFLWSDCADNSDISDYTAKWNLQFWDEEKCGCLLWCHRVLGQGG